MHACSICTYILYYYTNRLDANTCTAQKLEDAYILLQARLGLIVWRERRATKATVIGAVLDPTRTSDPSYIHMRLRHETHLQLRKFNARPIRVAVAEPILPTMRLDPVFPSGRRESTRSGESLQMVDCM
jgi:hypothetical protein